MKKYNAKIAKFLNINYYFNGVFSILYIFLLLPNLSGISKVRSILSARSTLSAPPVQVQVKVQCTKTFIVKL